MKEITSLCRDIDTLCVTGKPEVDPILVEQYLNDFAARVRDVAKGLVSPKEKDLQQPYLRPSNIGTPDRKLWFILNSEPRERTLDPNQLRSYAIGSIIEHLVVLLTKVSGHEVTDEQAEVEVDGIKGNMDLRIDGLVVDVKSSSPYSYPKFADGSLVRDPENNDIFGYVPQLNFYAKGGPAGWVAFNKSSGEMCLLTMDEFAARERLETLIPRKKAVANLKEPPPDKCYTPVPFGQSGNEVLHKSCNMCAFKVACWKDDGIRAFRYSDGIKYFTKVTKTPNVEEVVLSLPT